MIHVLQSMLRKHNIQDEVLPFNRLNPHWKVWKCDGMASPCKQYQ